MTAKRTPRLEHVEQQLRELAVAIDGRNARNGYCTWPQIRDVVEHCWALVKAELDGSDIIPAGPSTFARQLDSDLQAARDLADDLSQRLRLVSSAPTVYGAV